MKSMIKSIKKKFADNKTNKTSKRKLSKLRARGSKPKKKFASLEQQTYSAEDLIKSQKGFKDTSGSKKRDLFVEKLRKCRVMFDFRQTTISSQTKKAREVKREMLLSLVDYIGTVKNLFKLSSKDSAKGSDGEDEEKKMKHFLINEVVTTFKANVFRPLPPKQNNNEENPEDDEPIYDVSWPHLQIAYELFLRFIVLRGLDDTSLRECVDERFILQLLVLFDSEDPRERDYLKTILHRIYAKVTSLRHFIRKNISNVLHTFLYDKLTFNGIPDLLEILGSIINGFAIPLKSEHITFLKSVLMPMHKSRSLTLYHQQLSYCVTQYIEKQQSLSLTVLAGMIKYWPLTSSSKEVLFINELEEILELTPAREFEYIMVPLFKKMACSIGSRHFQVAERALFLWHNEYIASLIADQRDELLPVLLPVLHRNSRYHWNQTVTNLTLNILKIFMELDARLFERSSREYAHKLKQKRITDTKIKMQWEAVAKKASHTAQASGLDQKSKV